MAKFFFNLPLPNHPALVQSQNFLRRILAPTLGVEYQSPETFHITMLAIDDAKAVNPASLAVPEHLPVFGVSGWGMDILRGGDKASIVLRIDHSPSLNYLQMALYLEAAAAGVTVGAFSYPFTYRAHITLARLNSLPLEWDGYMSDSIRMEVSSVALTSENYVTEKEWTLRNTMPVAEQAGGIAIAEQSDARRKPQVIFELAEIVNGNAPNIPLPADIDTALLAKSLRKASPDDLVFDTRPIGSVTESRNSNKYGKQFVQRLVEQVNAKRPEGRWGHLSDEEIGTTYEMPAVRWLAAKYDGKTQTAWGKLIALTEESERHIQSAQAAKARIGTSIYGFEPVVENGETVDFDLVTIDLANAERVGIPEMSTVPSTSSEMSNSNQSQENDMGSNTETPIAELQDVSRLRTLLEAAETKVTAQQPAVDEHKLVCELMSIGKDGDVVKAVRELAAKNTALQAENAKLLEETIVSKVKDVVAVEAMQPMVIKLVTQEKPDTREAVTAAVTKVMAEESTKQALGIAVAEAAGPAVGETLSGYQDKNKGKEKRAFRMPG